MYTKVNTPVLGVVENMAYYLEQDGARSYIFGEGGARRTAKERGVEFLGEVPLDANIRSRSDVGVPIVVADPDGAVSQIYIKIADRLMEVTKPFDATAAA
jgi:ATP-binding protein involved in chromosome partitioning